MLVGNSLCNICQKIELRGSIIYVKSISDNESISMIKEKLILRPVGVSLSAFQPGKRSSVSNKREGVISECNICFRNCLDFRIVFRSSVRRLRMFSAFQTAF